MRTSVPSQRMMTSSMYSVATLTSSRSQYLIFFGGSAASGGVPFARIVLNATKPRQAKAAMAARMEDIGERFLFALQGRGRVDGQGGSRIANDSNGGDLLKYNYNEAPKPSCSALGWHFFGFSSGRWFTSAPCTSITRR